MGGLIHVRNAFHGKEILPDLMTPSTALSGRPIHEPESLLALISLRTASAQVSDNSAMETVMNRVSPEVTGMATSGWGGAEKRMGSGSGSKTGAMGVMGAATGG